MLTHNSRSAYDIFKFRKFRLNLICFLKLPLNVSEDALHHATIECSRNLFTGYLARKDLAHAGPRHRRSEVRPISLSLGQPLLPCSPNNSRRCYAALPVPILRR
jgi:hypothetical protein